MNFCKKCGALLPEQASRCPMCGAPTAEQAPVPAAEPALTAEQPAPGPEQPAPAQTVPAQPTPEQPTPEQQQPEQPLPGAGEQLPPPPAAPQPPYPPYQAEPTPVYARSGGAEPPHAPQPAPGPRYAAPETGMGMAGYLGTLLLFLIPVVGLVLMLVWSFGHSARPERKKLAQAYLIRTLLLAAICVVLVLVFGTVFFTLAGSMHSMMPYYYYGF